MKLVGHRLARGSHEDAAWRRPRRGWLAPALALAALATPALGSISSREQILATGTSGSSFGKAVAGAGDVNGDGYDDIIVGAPRDSSGSYAGRAYVYFGGPEADAVADLTLTGRAANHDFGNAVAGAGDVNGDGFADLIVGAHFANAAGLDAGEAYVYFGSSIPDAIPDLTLLGEAAGDRFGCAVAGARDVDGDGFDDLLVGARGNDGAGTNAGRAYLYLGGPGLDANPDWVASGETPGDEFGMAVGAAGDVDGDHRGDLIVGAALHDQSGPDAGAAYIYLGGAGLDARPDRKLNGNRPGDQFGISVAAAGDVNGDGYDDVIVGAHLNDAAGISAGAAYVHCGGATPDTLPDLVLAGRNSGDRFGISVAGAGDVNGDGFGDWLVGADADDRGGAPTGRMFVYHGAAAPDGIADLTCGGDQGEDQLGVAVAGAGDLNADGFDDVMAGASGSSRGGPLAGLALVIDHYRYRLITPNGGELWPVGSLQWVWWRGHDLADLWLSTDGGDSWEPIERGVGGDHENRRLIRVPNTPTSRARIRLTPAGTSLLGDRSDSVFTIRSAVTPDPRAGPTLLGVVDTGELFASEDRGATWSLRAVLPCQDPSAMVRGASRDELYLASVAGRVFRSTDGGASWTARATLPASGTSALVVSGRALWACTEGGEVFRSLGSGETWVSMARIAADDVVAAVTRAGSLFALTRSGFVHRSDDYGQSWRVTGAFQTLEAVGLSADSSLYALTATGDLARGDEDGGNWTLIGTVGQLGMAALLRIEGEWMVATEAGEIAASDDGSHWSWQGAIGQPSLRALVLDWPPLPEPSPAESDLVFSLSGPSPVRGPITFVLELGRESVVDVEVFDLAGRRVARPLEGAHLPGGSHVRSWTPDRLEPGIYHARARAVGLAQIKRIVWIGR